MILQVASFECDCSHHLILSNLDKYNFSQKTGTFMEQKN